ncbi:hypothetical protein EIN_026640 [Entamoeba invadens IP1]|uniref:hypothetical protein n=1 Tax=Entamoeba invadens IP1 TaxID=370355 RepID=UPI0002C3F7D9|nr:hypothetical protein EIN_026640 [Entamoeba invadens IP1]ELP90795.1 hypothetical protein EIN_026640 [Entamoeba invadens IP1]|eukprot:XP_004257566.1 hypothetical protein EIN_026640 [Entamoeba invadens IP1]
MVKDCKWFTEKALSVFWNFPRACYTGFVFNFANYFYWLVVPLIMNDKGGSTFDLSLLQTVGFVIYAVLSPIAGKLGDKVNPYIIVRVGFLFFIAAVAVILIFPSSIPALYVSVCIWPFCTSIFWSVTTGTIGFESPLGYENRNTSLYQVSWSFGKCFGFLFGGLLKTALGTNSLYICIALIIVTMVLYPFTHPKRIREKKRKFKDEKKKNDTTPKDIAIPVESIHKGPDGIELVIDKKAEPQPIEHKDDIHDIEVVVDASEVPSQHKEGEAQFVPESLERKSEVVEAPTSPERKSEIGQTPRQSEESLVQTEVYAHHEDQNTVQIKFKWSPEELSNKTFIIIGYIQQCAIYGTSAVISSTYVKLAIDLEVKSPTALDMYIGIVFFFYFLAQTVVMVGMSLTLVWTYKRSLFLLFQTGFILFLLIIGVSRNAYLNWFMAFIGGLAGGFAYQTSTYYSMRASEESKSMFMGISEGVSGLGNSLLPFISGLLCTYLNNNYIQIYVGVIFMVICIVLEEVYYHIGTYINNKRQEKRVDPSPDYQQVEMKQI